MWFRLHRVSLVAVTCCSLAVGVAGAAVLPHIGSSSPAAKASHRASAPTASVAQTPHSAWRLLLGHKALIRRSRTNAAGSATAFRFRGEVPGTARTISVYVRAGSTSTTLVAGLYAGQGSDPGSRLASSSTRVRGSGRWVTLAISHARIVTGRVYWIAVLGRGGVLKTGGRRSPGCLSVTDATAHLSALPRTWKPGTARAACVSAYVSGSQGSSTGPAGSPPPPTPPPPPSGSGPVNNSAPTISGTADVGSTLSASPGSWTGDPTSYAYQWQDCSSATNCTDITGATGSSDALRASDAGDTIDVVVTATDADGSTAATSAPTQIVAGSGTGEQSVAFWLAWSPIDESQIPWNAVTQVDLSALSTTTKSSGCSSDCTSLDPTLNGISNMNVPSWVSVIHQHGKLAMISIGGSTDQDWAKACAAANLPGFTSKLVSYMVSNGFDGVDIDIESLAGSGKELTLWASCEEAIAKAAHAATTQAGKTPLVSADVDQSWMDSPVATFAQWPDQFNLMYYGYPTGSYSCANGCAQVDSLVQALHTTGQVPYDRMMLGMSPGGGQAQSSYQNLSTTSASVDTSGSVSAIALSSGLSAALPAGNVVLATTENPPSHYEIFTTSGAAQGATSIPITGTVSGSGAYAFPSGSDVQSDYAGPWDCGNFAAYAAATGLKGVMIWDLQEEQAEHNGQYPCFAQVAPYVGATP